MGRLRRCTFGVVLFIAAAFAVAPTAGAADDYYLRIEGIQGESTASGLPPGPTPIDLQSFDWSAQTAITIGSSATGASAGKTELNAFTVTKSVDIASVPLFQRLATATQIPTMELIVRQPAGPSPFIFLRYCFQHVYVTSQDQSSGSAGNPVETVKFLYESVTQTYTPESNTGAALTPFDFGWSQTTNAEASPLTSGVCTPVAG